MIYGMYLSATGVMTNSHRQDVISNNLANAQTTGFKRSLALFQQRAPESSALGQSQASDPMLDNIGGGLLLSPTYVDRSQGTFESGTGNLDVAIHGNGFFAVKSGDQTRLTRNGAFLVDRAGYLVMADSVGNRVLDKQGQPIQLGNAAHSPLTIGPDGTISANEKPVAQIGVVDVPDPKLLQQNGGTLLNYPDMKKLKPADGTLASGFIESSNVDPTTELTQLINAQRELEANANMIRFQDQSLSRLVNEVGKVG